MPALGYGKFAAAKEPASPQSVLVLARPASESNDYKTRQVAGSLQKVCATCMGVTVAGRRFSQFH